MSDSLPRRMSDLQTASAAAGLARDADRLAETARQFAADVRAGGHPGGAYQIAQAATDLLREASRLDGMRNIAALLGE